MPIINRKSSLTVASYTQALVDYATQIDDSGPLETLRDLLFVKISGGDGKTLVTTSPVGKTFSFEITMTIEEQFSAVVAAIKAFNADAGDSPITFVDFSRTSGLLPLPTSGSNP